MQSKKSILNIASTVSTLNMAFIIVLFFYVGHITGNIVLDGKIAPGQSFNSDFNIENRNEVTLIFDSSRASWEDYPPFEVLQITILDPKGNIALSELKEIDFSTTGGTDGKTLIRSKTDTGVFFEPRVTGKYHIMISDAKFPTGLSINSGMINPSKKPVIAFLSFLLSFLILLVISINLDKKNEYIYPSLQEVIIALPISLITAGMSIYMSGG